MGEGFSTVVEAKGRVGLALLGGHGGTSDSP